MAFVLYLFVPFVPNFVFLFRVLENEILILKFSLDITCALHDSNFVPKSFHPAYNNITMNCIGFNEIGIYDCDLKPSLNQLQRVCACTGKGMSFWSLLYVMIVISNLYQINFNAFESCPVLVDYVMIWIKEPFYKERKINNRCSDFLSKQNIIVPLILDINDAFINLLLTYLVLKPSSPKNRKSISTV